MKIIKGFPADPEGNYQLNVIKLMEHGVRNYGRQEIVSRKNDGTLFRYTYKDSYERMKRLANALVSIGVNVGDRVGVLSWNTHQFFEIYYGVPGIGAVMLTLNLRLAKEDIAFVINHAEAEYIIVDESLISIAEEISPLCQNLRGFIIILDGELSEIRTSLTPIYSYEEILKNAASEYIWPILDETSSYAACYTTGTTGKPKGVYYSHRNTYLQAMMFAAQFYLTINDVVLQLVPMFHVLGWSKPLAAPYVGAKLVFSGKWGLDDLAEITDLIIKEKVTASGGVPAVFMAMLELIKKMEPKPDLNGARFICGGSEPPITLMKGMWDLAKIEIIHSYGSTEAMALTTLNMFKPWLQKELSEEELWEIKKKQGIIISGLDVKIIDEEGNELPHDGKSSGEILISGPWVTRSYLNAPDSENYFTEDGYFRSGDAGSLDSEGLLKITDRIKDVIKSGGEWISSIDMENALMSHPGILEAAVVGVPHPKWVERPLALVVLREEYGLVTKEEIREHIRKLFAKWQLPDEILFVNAIPRTSVGKINKKVIRMEHNEIYSKNNSE